LKLIFPLKNAIFNSYVKLPEGIADFLLQMNVQSDELFAKKSDERSLDLGAINITSTVGDLTATWK
jgi:hypothetical protein